MDELEPIKVYDAWNPLQAQFVRQLLGEAGISARIASDALQSVIGEVPFQLATCPVWVTKADAARASAILEGYDEQLRDRAEMETQPPDPFCYHCGASVALGQTPCPACGCKLEWSESE